jgi:hypothetical protein
LKDGKSPTFSEKSGILERLGFLWAQLFGPQLFGIAGWVEGEAGIPLLNGGEALDGGFYTLTGGRYYFSNAV